MSDRHAELLRQRALIQQHLAWLDHEIAASASRSGATPGLASAPASTPPAPAPPAPTPTAAPPPPPVAIQPAPGTTPGTGPAIDPDSILDQYRRSPGSLQSDVRKGCFLYFAAALVLLGLGVMALYYMISSR